MKKILLSITIIVFITAIFVAGGTGAFFSDSETSTANTFAAGAIDLKIDNTSYYNGQLNASTTWALIDLTVEKFFDFPDIKPGDFGEDTISLHVDSNDAYICANVALTSNDDNGLTEPESEVDANDGPGNGELAGLVNFIWWADDGDNVLESDEGVISEGPIGALGLNGSTTITLADSQTNIWTGAGGPFPGSQTLYIGKAWCFGDIVPSPLTQDGIGSTSPRTPGNSTGGISCDGTGLDNASQTDSLTADVVFTAIQARNNDTFLCSRATTTLAAKLTVVKVVTNDNGGNNVVPDFNLFVDDGFVSTAVTSGATTTLPAGTYTISETGVSGYVASFSGDCTEDGDVTVGIGEEKICYITNNDLPGNITLIKNVINNGSGTSQSSQFRMRIDGILVPSGSSFAVSANSAHTITEDPRAGYHFVSITGHPKCPIALGGTATLDEGEAITCTITNDDN
jgi:predicted ribosomally synthesized peptide with SipW-like signal peptide